MRKISKLKLNDFNEMSDSEMKNAIGGGKVTSITLQSCTCSNGKTFSTSVDWTCKEAAGYVC